MADWKERQELLAGWNFKTGKNLNKFDWRLSKSCLWDGASRSARDWKGSIGREDKGFLQDGASGLARGWKARKFR